MSVFYILYFIFALVFHILRAPGDDRECGFPASKQRSEAGYPRLHGDHLHRSHQDRLRQPLHQPRLPPTRTSSKVSHLVAALLTVPRLRLISSKTQERKDLNPVMFSKYKI